MEDDRHTPAMPNPKEGEWADPQTCKQWREYSGFSKAEYAAIHTGQPCSGTPWLDKMLAKARRERLAGQIAAGSRCAAFTDEATARHSVALAKALSIALEGGAK